MRVPSATAFAGVLLTIAAASLSPGASAAASQAGGGCVDIKQPKPSASYTYEHVESRGTTVSRTEVWEEVTATGSRVRTTLPNGTLVQVNEHHVVDDAIVLDRSTKRNASGGVIDSTMFRPGIVGDPGFRACTGHTWPIPSVYERVHWLPELSAAALSTSMYWLVPAARPVAHAVSVEPGEQ